MDRSKIIGILLIGSFIWAGPVFAADLFFNTTTTIAAPGQTLVVSLLLDAGSDQINAVEGTVRVSSNFEVKSILDADSFINFWIERPTVRNDGTVRFAGIVPGGYQGKDSKLLSFQLNAAQEGEGNVTITDFRILRNDGAGSMVETTAKTLSIEVVAGAAPISEPAPPADTISPEPFTPEIAHDPNLFDNQWFLVFATQDKDSGIDHYEVREGSRASREAMSPYLLKNQRLDDTIVVRAYDRAGNFREASISPTHRKPWYRLPWALVTTVLILIMVLAALARLFYRYKKV